MSGSGSDDAKSVVSSNPFASERERKVENLDPSQLLYSGSKVHAATLHRHSNDPQHLLDRHNIASAHDDLTNLYLTNVFQVSNQQEFEEYVEQHNKLSIFDNMYWPDMALHLVDAPRIPGDDEGLVVKYIFVHSLVLRRCTYFEEFVQNYQRQKTNAFPVVPIPGDYVTVLEVLRFLYLREISLDVTSQDSIKNVKALAAILKNQDLDFAVVHFSRQSKFREQDELNPFKIPTVPESVKKTKGRTGPYTTKKPAKNKKKTSRYDPFGTDPKQDPKPKIVSNSELLKRFLDDTQKNQDDTTDSTS